MVGRNDGVKALRPEIQLPSESEDTDLLNFQNQVLRPILKLQNDVLVAAFHNKCISHGVVLGQFDSKKRAEFVQGIFTKDHNFKNLALGMVLGMLTSLEQTFYFEHQKNINKRVFSMLRERILDNLNSE